MMVWRDTIRELKARENKRLKQENRMRSEFQKT
jgi:hypothetical protein